MSRLLWFAFAFSLMTLEQTEGYRCQYRVNCAVTWRSWSSCSRSCGGGTQYRHGSITRQPACGGSPCPALKQYQSCNSHNCAVNGGWSSWGRWSRCSKTCGTGLYTRYRACTAPRPSYGGKSCVGSSRQRQSCYNRRCPVHGGWSSWGAWGSCSRTCGTGNQNRHRSCTAPVPKYRGRSCSGVSRQSKSCYRRHCPVNGGWSSWGSWSRCSKTCGTGLYTRYRVCTAPRPLYGGRSCVGSSRQQQSCYNRRCPVHGGWSSWSAWGSCSRSCGTGNQNRHRSCTAPVPKYRGRSCSGVSRQFKSCYRRHCPVNGGWSSWGSWSRCSKTCGTGLYTRYRVCTAPRPLYGGRSCVGSSRQQQSCYNRRCPVLGGWSSWGAWGSCSRSCGTGNQNRHRSCTAPVPKYGGRSCPGVSRQVKSCYRRHCPVNGGWSSWGSWSRCSKTCGTGLYTRYRVCTAPRPLYGGRSCVGSSRQQQSCYNRRCPVLGGWSSWGAWGSCSRSCGTGNQNRHRSCTAPVPKYGGRSCPGVSRQVKSCYRRHCPVNGGWSSWGSWSRCSKTCGTGLYTRYRVCTAPRPLYGGRSCVGSSRQQQSCYNRRCPVHGGWSSWGAWGSCSRSCGTGNQNRHRSCTAPVPKYRGRSCSGVSRQSKSCYRRHCPVNGGWSSWGSWSRCSKTCGTGLYTRYRVCTAPRPLYGGKSCVGSSRQQHSCSNRRCTSGVGCYANFPHSILLGGFKSEIQWFGRPLPYQIKKVIKKCAGLAAKKGMKYYALEDFGNCYGARTFSAYSQTKATCCFLGAGLKKVYFVYKA
ncbi:coadhesin-like isoform X1 [Acropora muricata]|uniref:coadhesin-like isoform X1 n=1 Tax=Acropora muricata TaxID=159855 RepID=UPI0034E460D0